MRAGRYSLVDGQVIKKAYYIVAREVSRMLELMKIEVLPEPVSIDAFSGKAVVPTPEFMAYLC